MFRQKKGVRTTSQNKPSFGCRWLLIVASCVALLGMPQLAFASASENLTTGSIETTAEVLEPSELNDWSGTFKHDTRGKDRNCCPVCDALITHLIGQVDHSDLCLN